MEIRNKLNCSFNSQAPIFFPHSIPSLSGKSYTIMHTIRKYSLPNSAQVVLYFLYTSNTNNEKDNNYRFAIRSCIAHWKDGKMIEEYLHWDNQAFMKQIGLGQ